MADKEKCENKIEGELKQRIAWIEEMFTKIDKAKTDKAQDEAHQELDESPLALSHSITVKLELSWGGPADFFIIEVDPETKEIGSIYYHFQDWFDGASRELQGEDYEVAKRYAEHFVECLDI